jgi:hypothetical protein
VSGHRWPVVFGVAVVVASGPSLAQDFTQGKTPAQLFAGDCAACHKSPQGLARGGDPRSIASFLREHYTTKPDMAQALAAYIVGAGGTARGQPSTADRGDASGLKPGNRASASSDTGRGDPNRGADSARPRAAIPGSDEARSADTGDNPKPATRPRAAVASGDAGKPTDGEAPKQSGKPRSASVSGDAPKSADERDGPKAKPTADAKRSGDEDAASDAPKSKPRAAGRTEDGKKPGDAPVQSGKLNSYARTGSSDKEKVTDSVDTRVSKLREYATSGEAAPSTTNAVPKAVIAPAAVVPAGDDSSNDADKATTSDALKPALDQATKPQPNEAPSPVVDEAPKPPPARKSSDAGRPSHRSEATGSTQPSSPMSFFGRIFTGGARPRDTADPPN